MSKTVKRILKQVLLTHPTTDQQLQQTNPSSTHTSSTVTRKKGARQPAIDCRRVVKRQRREIRPEELTDEFFSRLSTLCIESWRILTRLPSFSQHKSYNFPIHCIVIMDYASTGKGFRCNLFQVEPEPLLVAGFPPCSKLVSYGFSNFNDAETTFLALLKGNSQVTKD
jgi:hypothetical protein